MREVDRGTCDPGAGTRAPGPASRSKVIMTAAAGPGKGLGRALHGLRREGNAGCNTPGDGPEQPEGHGRPAPGGRPPSMPPSPCTRPLTVLVVDDRPDVADSL